MLLCVVVMNFRRYNWNEKQATVCKPWRCVTDFSLSKDTFADVLTEKYDPSAEEWSMFSRRETSRKILLFVLILEGMLSTCREKSFAIDSGSNVPR